MSFHSFPIYLLNHSYGNCISLHALKLFIDSELFFPSFIQKQHVPYLREFLKATGIVFCSLMFILSKKIVTIYILFLLFRNTMFTKYILL